MEPEEQDEIWKLLGKARPVTVSPFFSRNVLRALRQSQTPPRTFLSFLNWKICSSAAVLFLALSLYFGGVFSPEPSAQMANVSPQEYETVVNMDELLALEENSLWLDDDTYSSF